MDSTGNFDASAVRKQVEEYNNNSSEGITDNDIRSEIERLLRSVGICAYEEITSPLTELYQREVVKLLKASHALAEIRLACEETSTALKRKRYFEDDILIEGQDAKVAALEYVAKNIYVSTPECEEERIRTSNRLPLCKPSDATTINPSNLLKSNDNNNDDNVESVFHQTSLFAESSTELCQDFGTFPPCGIGPHLPNNFAYDFTQPVSNLKYIGR